VFGGTPGTVTVVGSIAFTGLQFLTDGYSLVAGAGAELTTSTPDTVVLLNPGVEATVEVPITGTGGINIQGGGTFVTTANNGYTGGTTIGPASTLQLGNGGTSGSIVGDVTNDGTLAFNRADTVSFGGTISGTGTVQQDGPGTLVLTGTNSYSGGTMFNAGIVSVSEDANLGAPSGSLTFNGGTLHTTADLSSARSTTIAGASGTIDTDEQTTFSLSGAISGSGALVKVGEGRLLLSGSNTYSGGTLVSAGTLQGNTRSLQGTIVDNASLVFDQDNDGTFRGTLFGTGTLTKRGAGLVRLTGDHGLQGMTSVLAGTLDLDGSLAGSVTVASGATFSATGLIGGGLISSGTVVVGASGAVTSATTGLDRLDGEVAATSPDHLDEQVAATSPAAGPGRLGVVGDITLSPGSQLHLGIDAAAGSASLVTDGRASIDGTSIVVDARKDGFSRVTHYAIVGARNGLTGLATVTSTSTSLEPYLSRDAGTLFVTLLRTDIPLQPFAVTGNGWGVGGAFDRTRASATGDLLYVTRQLTALDDAQLGSALDAVSGEIHASPTQLAAIDGESVMDVTRSEISSRIAWRDRVAEGAPGSRASLWGADRLRPWFRVRSDFGSFDAGSSMAGQGDRPAAHGADTMLNGVTGGLDWSFANEWLAGVGGSYADGKMTLDDLNEQSEFAAPRVLGYLGYAHDRWAVHTGVSVAHTMYDVTRRFGFAAIAPSGQPLFGTVEREARSTPAGTASDVWVEGRYNTPIGSWDLQPRIGLRAAWYRLGDWSETGADSLSLGAAAHTNSSLQGDIGLRTARAIGNVRPFLEGMYRRELSSRDLNTTIALTDQPGGLFEVEGLGLTADKFVGQAGALFLTDHVGLSLLYELHYAGAQTRHGLQFGVGF
jgi:autotransporter-associated beta strand protein